MDHVLVQVNIARPRCRRAWFEPIAEAHPMPYAFTLREHFPPPGAAARPARSPEKWTCPP